MLSVGDVAPDFKAKDQNGKEVSLGEYKGKPVVLYFYPKDNTPGCTKEACSFRDDMGSYKDAEVAVLGVSADGVDSHRNFTEKYGLNFTLVSDKDKSIINTYGVGGLLFTKRTTFIIDGDGKIAYVFPSVSPEGHAKEVLEKLRELKLID
ncbi:MAG: peroxiredoxin [Nitrososphaerota archaeon]|jgi:peroxiredoxin Q/BCP|nr:peroxiredoxin [Nitrososphaerota archaeon]MDG7043740.1 peroxiredoxin [Nitrososphaerota archaeon]